MKYWLTSLLVGIGIMFAMPSFALTGTQTLTAPNIANVTITIAPTDKQGTEDRWFVRWYNDINHLDSSLQTDFDQTITINKTLENHTGYSLWRVVACTNAGGCQYSERVAFSKTETAFDVPFTDPTPPGTLATTAIVTSMSTAIRENALAIFARYILNGILIFIFVFGILMLIQLVRNKPFK
jgi:hypothetical protein